MKHDDLRNERLVPLSAMDDYKVAKDNPDVVGWRVVGADGDTLGVVRDLIVDPRVMKVRYLSVVADRRFFNTDADQHMLVPIGLAALDKSSKKVFVTSIDSRTIVNYPIYPGGPITEDYEHAVRDTIHQSQREALHGTADDHKAEFDEALRHQHSDRLHTDHQHAEPRRVTNDFYDNSTFDENRFYTSDQQAHRDILHSSSDRDRTDRTTAATDLHQEDIKSKSVEESIATIERLELLREKGSITEEEFMLLKKRALNL
ncbi:PRC-barrel domain-containing protein [Pontibacter korlensis]|uniref:PRC-barrel domain-containing protein n=1 Tax=Pontibacter korlensis TaxID=400092 RepID=A0A0E3ZHZ0_9BACT|nr:PRC-barrel domain-containing protein [Pontibacter korlensis]AKD05040.1 hypothetical protein PKOR_20655 [Pontibacter korlensis]